MPDYKCTTNGSVAFCHVHPSEETPFLYSKDLGIPGCHRVATMSRTHAQPLFILFSSTGIASQQAESTNSKKETQTRCLCKRRQAAA